MKHLCSLSFSIQNLWKEEKEKNSDEEILQKLQTICLRENPIGSPPNNGLNQLVVGFCEA